MSYLPSQMLKKEFRLPMVPGSTCGEEMLRRNYHRTHVTGAKSDCGTKFGDVPQDFTVENRGITLPAPSGALAGATAQGGVTGSTGFGSGNEEDLSGHVCRFYGFTIEPVMESPKEVERVRKITIQYYLEDGTMSVTEPKEDNNGIAYNIRIKRHLVPLPNGATITLDNLKVGEPISFYGQTYLIYDADGFTREFFKSKGVALPPAGKVPMDAFAAGKKRAPRAHDVPSIASTSPLNIMLTPEQVRATQQFLAHDREVLRCDCTFDDTEKLYGVKHYLTLYYFLSDGSIALVEKETQNSGRDPFPNFFRRQKIAIPTDPSGKFDSSSLGSVAFKEDKNTVYYSDKDIRIGNVLHLYNRDVLIHGYNQYTKEYLEKTFGVTNHEVIPGAVPPPFVPPGSIHRQLTEEERAEAKKKKSEEIRRRRLDDSTVKYLASMENHIYEDEIRRFVITVYPANNTIAIYEPIIRNSGIVGGKFLSQQPVMHANGKRPVCLDDFEVGGLVYLNCHPFRLLASNEGSPSYSDIDADDLTQEELLKIIFKLQAMLLSSQTGLAEAFAKADINHPNGLDINEVHNIFSRPNMGITEKEMRAVIRYYSAKGHPYVAYEELIADVLKEGSRVASDDRPWYEIYEEIHRKEEGTLSAAADTAPQLSEEELREVKLASEAAKELMELYDQRRQLFVKELRTIVDYASDSLIGVDEFKRCIRQKLEIRSISDEQLNALCSKLFTPSFERITFEEMHRLLKGTSSLKHNFKEIIAETSS